MTGGEDELEAGCAAGDPDALAQAAALVSDPHPYTRARAAEMLAGAPGPKLAPIVASALDRDPQAHALWWRVLTLFAERERGLPGELRGADVARWLRSLGALGGGCDPDVLFHALAAASAAAVPGRAGLAAPFVEHRDEEVALRAAMVVAEERALAAHELERLHRVRGPERLHALVLLLEQGQRHVGFELASLVLRAGPFAYHVLDTLEQHGDASALPPLRKLYRRRLFPTHVASRAAAAAARLSDPEALPRLRELCGALRRDTRAVALAELLRVGDEADAHRVVERVRAGDAAAAFVVSEAWRADRVRAAALLEWAAGHPDPEIRSAAMPPQREPG